MPDRYDRDVPFGEKWTRGATIKWGSFDSDEIDEPGGFYRIRTRAFGAAHDDEDLPSHCEVNMGCPRCASNDIRRSRNSDWPLLRLILCVRARCHWCGLLFIAPMWRASKPEAAPGTSQPERRAA